MKETVTATSLFGIFANARMTNGKDWLKLDSYKTPSFTVEDLGSSICRYQYAFLYTIYYSFAINDESKAYYLRKITQTPLYTTVQVDTTDGATASFSLQHSFKYVYVAPNGSTSSSLQSSNRKYGTGLPGLITQFFSEAILPLVKPSSVRND